jgi:hypothetical protein
MAPEPPLNEAEVRDAGDFLGWLAERGELTWDSGPQPANAFVFTVAFPTSIESIDRTVYRRELYRRPGPREGKAYGRARHRAMKKARHTTAWAAARTIHYRSADWPTA